MACLIGRCVVAQAAVAVSYSGREVIVLEGWPPVLVHSEILGFWLDVIEHHCAMLPDSPWMKAMWLDWRTEEHSVSVMQGCRSGEVDVLRFTWLGLCTERLSLRVLLQTSMWLLYCSERHLVRFHQRLWFESKSLSTLMNDARLACGRVTSWELKLCCRMSLNTTLS